MSSCINHVDLVKSVITPSPCFFTPHNSIHWKNVQQDSAFFFPLAQDLNVLDKTLDTELCPTSRLLNGQSLIWWNSCLIPGSIQPIST